MKEGMRELLQQMGSEVFRKTVSSEETMHLMVSSINAVLQRQRAVTTETVKMRKNKYF